MNSTPSTSFTGVIAGLFLGLGLIVSTMLITRTWLNISESHVISVTGSARTNVTSNLAVWNGSFSTESTNLNTAQTQLKLDLAKLAGFLTENQFTNFMISPITIQPLKGKASVDPDALKTVGYRLTQKVSIHSSEIDRIIKLDRDSVKLVELGLLFAPSPIEFIYSKAAEAKVEMLGEATKDARARAEQIAQQGKRNVKALRSARMGVFQITPVYSNETSGTGINDTTSQEKTITAVVSVTFSME